MKKIAIVGAMAQEVEILKGKMQNCQTSKIAGSTLYEGQLCGKQVIVVQSGIGKTAAALGVTALILSARPDCVINTGSAGGLLSSLEVGDIVVSQQTAYHDADVTAFGYEKGQLPACPARFEADSQLIALAQKVAKQQGHKTTVGLVCSGDQFINGEQAIERIRKDFKDVIAVEMEAAAIAHVCHAFQLPFVVVRAISDVADKNSHLSFDEFLPLAAKNSSEMILAMLAEL